MSLESIPTPAETRNARRKVLTYLAQSWAAYQEEADTFDILPCGYYGFLAALPWDEPDADDATVAGSWGGGTQAHNVSEERS